MAFDEVKQPEDEEAKFYQAKRKQRRDSKESLGESSNTSEENKNDTTPRTSEEGDSDLNTSSASQSSQ